MYNFTEVNITGSSVYTLDRKSGKLYILFPESTSVVSIDLLTGKKDVKTIAN